MKLGIALVFVGIVLAQNKNPAVCMPATCTTTLDCYDTVHQTYYLCCSGACKNPALLSANVFAGGSCTNVLAVLTGGAVTCGGFCDLASYCNSGGVCAAKQGSGCPCTQGTGLASLTETCVNECGNSSTGTSVCLASYGSLAQGATCSANSECGTQNCTGGKCVGLPLGTYCLGGGVCSTGLTCKYVNATYSCQPLCAVGAAGCCSYNTDCVGGDSSLGPVTTYCNVNTCANTLALGGNCSLNQYACSTGLACGCSGTGCSSYVCVTANSVADGAQCPPYNYAVCSPTSSCGALNSSNYVFTCIGAGSIKAGGACAVEIQNAADQDTQCASPATACADVNGVGQAICHNPGTVPLYGGCDDTVLPTDCLNGNRCEYNTTYPYGYKCQPGVPVGGNCTSSGSECVVGAYCSLASNPNCFCEFASDGCTCLAGLAAGATCATDTFNSPPCSNGTVCMNPADPSNACFDTACGCTCVSNTPVANGGACTYNSQCSSSSRCISGTCAATVGSACATIADCNPTLASYSLEFPPFDCDCNLKTCTSLNPVMAPTVFMNTQAPSPAACSAQQTAAMAAYPSLANYEISPVATDESWNYEIAPVIGAIGNAAIQSKLMAYLCCATCVAGNPAFEAVAGGWIGDCSKFTITPVSVTCGQSAGAALLNCFKSAAPQLATSIAAMGAMFFAVML